MTPEILARTQALERYMAKYGSALVKSCSRGDGMRIKKTLVYIDPNLGRLCADIVMENGDRIPYLLDVDPDWEVQEELDPLYGDNLDTEHIHSINAAAAERSRWEGDPS